MTIPQLLHAFAEDDKLALVLVLIAADVALGVSAAFAHSTFRFAYIGDFARTDLLGKVVPWFAVYSLDKVATADFAGVDVLAAAAGATYAAVLVALVGSLTSSLNDLGVPLPAPLAGGEKTTPPTPIVGRVATKE